jgi:hypothetical protein
MGKKDRVATTVRLPRKKLQLLKSIAALENRKLNDIFNQLVDEYIERHLETLEILRDPEVVKSCLEGLEEIKAGGGTDLNELDD